jgi:serine phosphatase RsbU (regulator of sigma subunit)
LQFAGANNPLYLIRDKEFVQFKGDNMPIGVYYVEKPFTNHEFDLQDGDLLYMTTDGYYDQFGGEIGRKFLTKRFRKEIQKISGYSLLEQKEYLENLFYEWKGKYTQIDDVTVFAFRYKS